MKQLLYEVWKASWDAHAKYYESSNLPDIYSHENVCMDDYYDWLKTDKGTETLKQLDHEQ